MNKAVFMDNKLPVNIINTNARSLRPKIVSFIECFISLALTYAIVTETWFAHGTALELESERLLLGHGLGIICLNRPPNHGLSHGGVAIIYKSSTAKLSRYKFGNPDNFEVLPTTSTIATIARKFFILAVYIPPGYPVPRGKACLQHVADIVLDIKAKFADPLILIAGDFNQWNISDALSEFPDLEEVPSPPTRGDRKIDKVFVNWLDDVHDSGCLPLLETDLGGPNRTFSDHKIQYVCARLVKKDPVKWERYSYRPFTKEGGVKFKEELLSADWQDVLSLSGSNQKADQLQVRLDSLMERYFPIKTVTRKDTDLPWINDNALSMIKKKNAIYKSEGKSDRWELQRAKVESYLEQRRLKFIEA